MIKSGVNSIALTIFAMVIYVNASNEDGKTALHIRTENEGIIVKTEKVFIEKGQKIHLYFEPPTIQ